MAHYQLPLTYDEIYKSLQKQFYVNIPFPLSQSVIDDAMQAFFKFLQESEDVKSHIDYCIAPLHRRGDLGYKNRDPNDHIYNDSKDFFHFHPAILDQYPVFLEQHPVVNDFMQKATPIWEVANEIIQAILQTFEPTFPGIGSRVYDTKYPHVLLRFLKYNWQSSGKYLAKPHFDAGSFTLAISESCPGLRIGSNPENLKLVEHKPNNALFMLSSNFKKVMETDQLYPGWHDVIQLDETLIGKPFARWALVAFIEAANVEALSRQETHKWYSEEKVA